MARFAAAVRAASVAAAALLPVANATHIDDGPVLSGGCRLRADGQSA
jgi:hypothetical protein